MMGFKSVINEFYARDMSKKVRAGKRARSQSGAFTANLAPIGYIKDPKNKRHLVVDEGGAKIVRYIFKLATQGNGITAISRILNAEGIPSITQYRLQTDENYSEKRTSKHPLWSTSAVRGVLENKTYLGYVVNGKTTTKSFKNRQLLNVPQDQWVEVANMHEPLIDEDTFSQAQKIMKIRRPYNRTDCENIFTGLVKCADCGNSVAFSATKYKETYRKFFTCNLYRSYSAPKEQRRCTPHYVPLKLLTDTVLTYIQMFAKVAKEHEEDLADYAHQLVESNDTKETQSAETEAKRLGKRADELDTIIEQLFESYSLGNVPVERFLKLSERYEKEQSEIKKSLAELGRTIVESKDVTGNAVQLLQAVQIYTDAETLTRQMLLDLVDKIVIHEGEGFGKTRKQKIEVYFRFVGAARLVE